MNGGTDAPNPPLPPAATNHKGHYPEHNGHERQHYGRGGLHPLFSSILPFLF